MGLPAVTNRFALTVFLFVMSGLTGCRAHLPSEENSPEICDGELAQLELIEIAKAAVRVTGGDADLFAQNYEVEILTSGCDYLVSAISRTTTNHFTLVVDRSGKIKSWPWCCEPSYFVEPAQEPL